MMLSLPNLTTIEVIGELSTDRQGPPPIASLREPAAKKIESVRLRGYIPRVFVTAICKASASSIVSLDLGVLEAPKVYKGDKDKDGLQAKLGYTLYVAPRSVLWYDADTLPALSFLTHLLLVKHGPFDAPPISRKRKRKRLALMLSRRQNNISSGHLSSGPSVLPQQKSYSNTDR
jgi:hypothetical protein